MRVFTVAKTDVTNSADFSVCTKYTPIAFLKNRFHIFEYSQSNQNEHRKQGVTFGCTDVVKSIIKAVGCSNQNCVLCLLFHPCKKSLIMIAMGINCD